MATRILGYEQATTKFCGRNVRLPASPQTTTQHCSTPTKGRLCHIGASPAAKQVERHHFLLADRCAIITCFSNFFFDFFDFSILNPVVSYPSTTAHPLDILIPTVAHHTPSEPPMLVFTSDFHVVVPTSLPLTFEPTEKDSLAPRGNSAGACKHGNIRWNAGYERPDWSDWYVGWMSH